MKAPLPKPRTPAERRRTAIWARMFLHAWGLLSDVEDQAVRKRIHQLSEWGFERRRADRRVR